MGNLQIMRKFKKVARMWNEIEKLPHNFDGTTVYHAEVYMLMNIARNPQISVTGLAKVLEITKGSVSEAVKKLEKKGYILKAQAPDNASKITLTVSAAGMKILEHHQKIHENSENNFMKYNEQLDKDEVEIIVGFFTKFEAFLNEIRDQLK